MEKARELLSLLAGLFMLAGFAPYLYGIIQSETVPSKVSWIIWVTLDTITLAGMYVEGTANYQCLAAVIGSWIVVIFALRYGISDWTKIDVSCLIGAIFGIALWKIFANPLIGIVMSLSIVLLGSIPTFISAWIDPCRENKLAWTIFWISCICAVMAIPHWTLAAAAQPITFFVVQTIMMYILYIHPRSLRNSNA
jgi:hypothetical protein